VRGLGFTGFVIASSREEEVEEEMNGAGAGHQQQQHQYQSSILAAATAAAMSQVVLPDPLFLICCFACALGGSNARRSASEPERLFLASHVFLRLAASLVNCSFLAPRLDEIAIDGAMAW
jgi:hypothetical protein